MNCVVLGLGSNRSYNGFDSVELLRKAVECLNKIMDDSICSALYRTKPMYVENQDYFYNMVIMGKVSDEYSPHKFLEHIHKIETLLGRDRSKEVRFGPRSIDIDIEFYGDEQINAPDLEIPHPRLEERGFVLQPLLEILRKSADVMKGEKLRLIEKTFADAEFADVELFMDSEAFLARYVEKEVQNGNRSKRSS